MSHAYDVVVVGGGINGMVCALLAARRGLSTLLVEGHTSLGGGVRTSELTLPGFYHDVCSAIHPFGRSSPILRSLDLEAEGLEWIDPEVPVAHPLIGEEAVLLYRSVEQTAAELGKAGRVYKAAMNSLLSDWGPLENQLLGPALKPPPIGGLPRLARFGSLASTPARLLGPLFGRRGSALWAGLAAHSLLPMESISSSAVACVLGLMAHKVGWPMPKGGAQRISDALEQKLVEVGVDVELGNRVDSLGHLPSCRAMVLDLSAKQVLQVAGPRLPERVRRGLRSYRLGPGIFKVDYALSEPVPWLDSRVSKAGTVHLGGSLSEISKSESAVWKGKIGEKPFLLAAQPTLFDPTRAPDGKHIFWIYIHTPNGSDVDCTSLIEHEMERYAPGFKDVVLEKSVHSAADFEAYNPNYVGGDILGGANTLWQVAARPRLALDPYHLGGPLYCCSASVPPGGGVHGMGGYHAFQSMLKRHFS